MQLRRGQAVNYWLGADEEPIEHALRDLSKDLKSVLAAGLRRSGRPGQADLVLVNLQHRPDGGLEVVPLRLLGVEDLHREEPDFGWRGGRNGGEWAGCVSESASNASLRAKGCACLLSRSLTFPEP